MGGRQVGRSGDTAVTIEQDLVQRVSVAEVFSIMPWGRFFKNDAETLR